jgi:lysophospholipase L1-like esterase
VIAMIGDSITADGRWWAALREQLLVHEPDLRCEFRNAGIPGGTVAGALRRYAWDIAPLRANVALVLFGMNDVGRDDYQDPIPDAGARLRQAGALARYRTGMAELVARLQADGVRVVLVTPSPYDEYATGTGTPARVGVDGALAQCARIVYALAAEQQVPVIDLHAPLSRRCAAGEALIDADRVHPTTAGHAAMAEVAWAQIHPRAFGAVPPQMVAASRAVHAAESQLRSLAMFKTWVEESDGVYDDAAVLALLDRSQPGETNPWMIEQMGICRMLLADQEAHRARIELLRRELAAVR